MLRWRFPSGVINYHSLRRARGRLPAQWVEESWSWNPSPDVEVIPRAWGGDQPERRGEGVTTESRSSVQKSYKTDNSDTTCITTSAGDVAEITD